MNYQILPLFFSHLSTLLFFLSAIGLTFFGLSAPVVYFILLVLVLPIGLSMHLHRLNETGTALTLSENVWWMTYVYGLPAPEQRAMLKNPCFYSTDRIQQFFIRGFAGKISLQLTCIAIHIYECFALEKEPLSIALALLVLLFLLCALGRSAFTASLIVTGKWQSETLTTDSGSVWYQGVITKGTRRETLFSRLV
ncbi:hypothetical protein [Intestinirhabdus alba]|jgi:hypothetical protein|uniref:Uncharacterized protein n=1 Tax=Intestinirhabdus alba TaxID=2899544 RepID=A0A6L6IIJ1_9ENTR|nr:hypothetical protein [Intestinirhabdus alba]MTH44910.1 hypothetical protein [Intestinirhabdus alba]